MVLVSEAGSVGHVLISEAGSVEQLVAEDTGLACQVGSAVAPAATATAAATAAADAEVFEVAFLMKDKVFSEGVDTNRCTV